MICASRPVPSVVVTSACVSPRVNSAEPCVRGSTPVSTRIWRTVCMSRPSMRGSPARMRRRTMLYSSSPNSSPPCGVVPRRLAARQGFDDVAFLISPMRVWRACFSMIEYALPSSASACAATAPTSPSCAAGALQSQAGLPALAASSLIALDRDLHLLVTEHDGAEHHRFRQQLGLGLDHQHGVGRTGDDQVEIGGLQVLGGRVQQVLAVAIADPRGADRALERDPRQRQRRGGAKHRRDVGIDLRVERHDRRDDLDFVEEVFRKQRTDRAVDQARRRASPSRWDGLRA